MDIHRRRIVAYIACNLLKPERRAIAIHDLNPPLTTEYSGDISPSLIAVFDPNRQDFVLGHRHSPNLIRLNDLASQHLIDLAIDSNKFEGVDHETGMRFDGQINEDLIQFLDHVDGITYEYRF